MKAIQERIAQADQTNAKGYRQATATFLHIGRMRMPKEDTFTVTAADIAKVKEDLPDLPVRVGEVVQTGAVRGRKERFARLFLDNGLSVEFAWDTVARAYKYGRTLQT